MKLEHLSISEALTKYADLSKKATEKNKGFGGFVRALLGGKVRYFLQVNNDNTYSVVKSHFWGANFDKKTMNKELVADHMKSYSLRVFRGEESLPSNIQKVKDAAFMLSDKFCGSPNALRSSLAQTLFTLIDINRFTGETFLEDKLKSLKDISLSLNEDLIRDLDTTLEPERILTSIKNKAKETNLDEDRQAGIRSVLLDIALHKIYETLLSTPKHEIATRKSLCQKLIDLLPRDINENSFARHKEFLTGASSSPTSSLFSALEQAMGAFTITSDKNGNFGSTSRSSPWSTRNITDV